MGKKAIQKYIERKDKRLLSDKHNTWHRKGYHRFFEGYAEYQIPVGGKMKIKRVYMGDYYFCDLSFEKKILLRILYAVILAAAITLFLIAGNMNILCNFYIFINLTQAFAVLGFGWCVIALLSYIICNKKMEIREYRSSVLAIRDATALTAVVLSIIAVETSIFAFCFDRQELTRELLSAGLLMIAVLLLAGIRKIESGIKYKQERSGNTIEDNAENVFYIKG